jgi:hypothetical protein
MGTIRSKSSLQLLEEIKLLQRKADNILQEKEDISVRMTIVDKFLWNFLDDNLTSYLKQLLINFNSS